MNWRVKSFWKDSEKEYNSIFLAKLKKFLRWLKKKFRKQKVFFHHRKEKSQKANQSTLNNLLILPSSCRIKTTKYKSWKHWWANLLVFYWLQKDGLVVKVRVRILKMTITNQNPGNNAIHHEESSTIEIVIHSFFLSPAITSARQRSKKPVYCFLIIFCLSWC